MNNYIAIMAGGVGTRFWPASRENKPKQFLDMLGKGKSLLQLTFERARKIVPANNILIVSNFRYKSLIQKQLPDLDEKQILLEPSMNNTAPCILYAALHLRARNPNANFAVLPSDHVVEKEDEFVLKMNQAFEFTSTNSAIVTLGIQPTRPDTGYGYINYLKSESAVKKVFQFKEKPDSQTAKSYMYSGNFLWNAGIFVWSVNTVLGAYQNYAEDILAILSKDTSMYGHQNEQEYINEVYPNTRNISVDYAIIEKSENVYTIPSDIGWSDLGTWNSLYNHLNKDQNQNIVQAQRNHLIEVKGCLIINSDQDKLIVVKGLENFIIVDDKDVLLVYPRNDEQEIKQVRDSVDYPGMK